MDNESVVKATKQTTGHSDGVAIDEEASSSSPSSRANKWHECPKVSLNVFGDWNSIVRAPQIHSYSWFNATGSEIQYAYEIQMSPETLLLIKSILNQEKDCNNSIIFAVQNMNSGGINSSSPAALKPHWVLMDGINMYPQAGENQLITADVNCRARVYEASARNICDIAKDIGISVHLAGERGSGYVYMTLSSNTHHLGFTNDKISRPVLWSVWYKRVSGGISDAATRYAGQTIAGLTLVLNDQDYNSWEVGINKSDQISTILASLPCVAKHAELRQILQF
jgi:hypothetical protein